MVTWTPYTGPPRGSTSGALEPESGVSGASVITSDFGLSTSGDLIPGSGKIYDNEDAEYSEGGSGWSDVITSGESELLSDWTLGTTHAAVAGTNRLGIVVASQESYQVPADGTITSWGGRPVQLAYSQEVGSGNTLTRLMVYYIREAEIAQMSGGTIVSAGDALDSIASAFYEGCNQSVPFPSACNKKEESTSTSITCTGFVLSEDDEAAIIAGTTSSDHNVSSVSPGFTVKIDDPTTAGGSQSLAVAHRAAVGISLQPTITWDGSSSRRIIWSAALGSQGAVGDAYNSTARQHASGAGSNTAIFAATGLPASISLLRIFAWYPTVAGAATDTNFVITGKYTDSAVVDQTALPGQWDLIKTLGSSSSGTTLTITIDDDANGIVLADAIKLEWETSSFEESVSMVLTPGLTASADTVVSEALKSLSSSILFLT